MSVLILKDFRDLQGISREEQADILEITIDTLNTWEYRNKEIPKSKLNYVKNKLNTYVGNMYKKGNTQSVTIKGVECDLKECADMVAKNYAKAKEVSKLLELSINNDNRDYLISYLEGIGGKTKT